VLDPTYKAEQQTSKSEASGNLFECNDDWSDDEEEAEALEARQNGKRTQM